MEFRHIQYVNYEPSTEEKIVLDAAIEITAQIKNENFLLEAAKFICKHTSVEFIGIGILDPDKLNISTCILLKRENALKNISYSIKGTPCEEVYLHKFCYFPFRVKEKFPDDKIIQTLKIESYLGTLLFSPSHEALGVVELMDTNTIKNPAFAEHLILILSPAIEEELIRLQATGKIA